MLNLWSEARMRVSHRLAMHVRVESTTLRNDGPMLSITFDDIPRSAATMGAALLEHHGARGTFYVAASLLGQPSPAWDAADAQDIAALHAAGHEIGCHTYSHLRVPSFDGDSLAAEFDQNRKALTAIDPGIEVENFAYPYGYAAMPRKSLLRETFRSCRGIVPGVNSSSVDLQFLRAMPLIDIETDPSRLDAALDETLRVNGWLILYTHDVTDAPSIYGCTPALMEHALNAARRRGIAIHTTAEALRCARV